MALTYTTTPSGVSFAKNPVLVAVESTATGYTTLTIKLTIHRSSDNEQLASFIHVASAAKTAQFNISEVLADELVSHTPAPGSAAVNTSASLVKEFYVRASEIIDGAEGAYTQSSNFFALNGGTSYLGYAEGLGIDLANSPTNEYLFLTTQPTPAWLNEEAPLDLTILPLVASATNTLVLTATYADGTTEDVSISLGALTVNTAVYLQVGDAVRAYKAAQPSKTWVKLSATITELTGQTFTWLIKPAQSPWQKHFLFQNSLGGFDTFTTSGKYTAQGRSLKQLHRASPKDQYTTQDKEISSFNHVFYKQFSVQTGPLTQQQMLVLQDLINSENVFEWVEESGQQLLVPVNILNDAMPIENPGQNINSLALNYRQAFFNKNFQK